MEDLTADAISILVNKIKPGTAPIFTEADGLDSMRFHNSLPSYSATKLHFLKELSSRLHVRSIAVKDESSRFGLNAFKGLGGSYAMFRILCEQLGLDPAKTGYRDFQEKVVRQQCSRIHFVTATDGNHGKGVSWAAKLFGCKATVYMPAGSVEARRLAIERAGTASAFITDLNYDRTVLHAKDMAARNGWILIQDTAWDGYEKIPDWIIKGYLTIAREITDQLKDLQPTHVFLQAGVGAMAGGVMSYLLDHYQDRPPFITIAEPSQAACVYHSIRNGDGQIHSLPGNSQTIMAGLNCGTPCKTTWQIMRDRASFFCACDDRIAEEGMKAYAHPAGNDPAVISGESGAVTLGLAIRILQNPSLRKRFGITENSVILLINTEGDTDPDGYRRIVYGTAG